MRNEGGGFAANIYGRCPKVCDGRFPSYRQPSPRGEGAPKGRIGHWRYEESGGKRRSAWHMWGKRESLTANDNDFAPLPLEGADERSEAGLASLNVGVPFHAANLRPFGAPPSKGRREKKGAACIVIGIVE